MPRHIASYDFIIDDNKSILHVLLPSNKIYIILVVYGLTIFALIKTTIRYGEKDRIFGTNY